MPTGRTIILNNCYFVPSIVRNIISNPVLDMDGFTFIGENNKCLIYGNKILYGCGSLYNGSYTCDLRHSILNVERINKRDNGNPT